MRIEYISCFPLVNSLSSEKNRTPINQMNKKQRLFGISLIVLGLLILLGGFMISISKRPLPAISSLQPVQRFDDENRNVLSWPEYEHSNQPFFGISSDTPLRDISPMTIPNTMRFGYQDDPRFYKPRFQEFIRRDTGERLPSLPTFQSSSMTQEARVGFVFDKSDPDRRFPLFAQPVYPGGNRFDYYVIDNSRNANPLGLNEHNGLELLTDDLVSIDSMPGKFFVHIY
jgi:hypothetical protein